MGKKNKGNSLGRALIKDRFSSRKGNKSHDSLLHTSELGDGYDWGRLNLQSVTEESSFEEFLSTAQLAETEFQAEKLNIRFVNAKIPVVGVTKEEREKFEKTRTEKREFIRIPRRPKWIGIRTKEELDALERESFLEWRRNLAVQEEQEGLTLTPYEKNLEFWRQLWRVVEKSDVVVQIVDARNPLLYRCEDLEDYVINLGKRNLLLVNKADLLTEEQRQIWADWFVENHIEAIFFSATQAGVEEEDEDEEEEEVEEEEEEEEEQEDETCGKIEENQDEEYQFEKEKPLEIVQEENENIEGDKTCLLEEKRGEEIKEREDREIVAKEKVKEDESGEKQQNNKDLNIEDSMANKDVANNSIKSVSLSTFQSNVLEGPWKQFSTSGKLFGRIELISLFESLNVEKGKNDFITIGLVGYPNVGKSSTINALMGAKRVSVSATPGKTKHFQTMFLSDKVMLCDCPGLVMPSMAESKAAMILAGVLPPDNMSDLIQPVELLATLVGRFALQHHYGVIIPLPPEGESPERPPTAYEFLGVYAFSRGFMTAGGRADCSRAARYVVKDFAAGRFIYAYAPPGIDQDDFSPPLPASSHQRPMSRLTPQALKATQMTRSKGKDLDEAFFRKVSLGVHTKGIKKISPFESSEAGPSANKPKPWKDHSEKRNRREKLKKIYWYLNK